MNIKQQLKDTNIITKSGHINPKYKIILEKNSTLLEGLLIETKFLPYNSSDTFRERLYCIINDITARVMCWHCKIEPVNFIKDGKKRNTYRGYCSLSCSNQSKVVQEKKREAWVKTLGVDNPSKSKHIKQKKINTSLANYNVKYPWQCKKVKETKRELVNRKYGVNNVMQHPDIQKNQLNTMIDRYGVQYAAQNPIFKKATTHTHHIKYGSHFSQRHIPSEALNKLNDSNWMYAQHILHKKTLLQISKELGVNDGTAGNYLHKHGINTQHYFQSTGENEVNQFVNSLGVPTIQGSRKVIAPYELDIYIPSHNLAIEYCGLFWHSEQQGKDRNYHKKKHNMCKELGIQLITLYEDEWLQRREQVEGKIKSLLNLDDREVVYARNTSASLITNKATVNEFFDNNHIQGRGPGSINIGLYCGELVAVMSFIKHEGGVFVLNRYATSKRVVGGFSKLLKHFKNSFNQWKQIISFADQRWSTGNLYQSTGWTLDTVIPPDYYYSPNGTDRIHKFNYRRHNLPRLLSIFDPNISETKNCDKNGILRIWDCGKRRYTVNN